MSKQKQQQLMDVPKLESSVFDTFAEAFLYWQRNGGKLWMCDWRLDMPAAMIDKFEGVKWVVASSQYGANRAIMKETGISLVTRVTRDAAHAMVCQEAQRQAGEQRPIAAEAAQ